MTSAEAVDIVSRIRYRTTWSLAAGEAAHDWVNVFVHLNEPDARDKTGRTPVMIYASIGIPVADADEQGLLRQVFEFICNIERHEAAEWFRYNETRPFDPHARDHLS
jgi:hypothetical protein